MFAVVLTLMLVVQGAPVQNNTGTITGVVHTADGKPIAGVRVAAMAPPESRIDAADPASSESLAGLAKTDDQGRYRLEGVPSGKYYVAAGKVDSPTFFPGTTEMSKGTTVSVAASAVIPNIDFVLDESSIRTTEARADMLNYVPAGAGLTLPVQVRVDGNSKQPVFANGKPVIIRATRKGDGMVSEMPLNDSVLNFPIPKSSPGDEYRISIENLPTGYTVKAMSQDGVDMLKETLKITKKDFVEAPIALLGGTLPGALLDIERIAYDAGAPMTTLEVTLSGASTSSAGVKIRGQVLSRGNLEIEMSGANAVLFSDRSFEISGVPPGRHVVIVRETGRKSNRTLAASIVAGSTDLNDVNLDEVSVLPTAVQFPSGPLPSTPVTPLAAIRGTVSGSRSGTVTLSGKTRATFPINSDGTFEIRGLLPGTYELTVDATKQSVTVGDSDQTLNILVK